MLVPLLLVYLTNLALAFNNSHQFIKDVMELPLVDKCDLGYVYEKINEDNLIHAFGLLPNWR